IRVGYELIYLCPKPTPMILTLSVHYSRVSDVIRPDHLVVSPSVPVTAYRDWFGNWCSRIVAPQGSVRLSAQGVLQDSGLPETRRPGPSSARSPLCPTRPCPSCSAAGTARPTCCPR